MEGIIKKLIENGQNHLVQFCNELDESQLQRLISDINRIDFKFIKELYNKTKEEYNEDDFHVEQPNNVCVKENLNENIINYWETVGAQAIRNNKLAVITMAGGQGTRLGHSGPKGTYTLNLSIGSKSIFEVLIDKLKCAREKYGVSISWYIMTSVENHDETVKFFNNNNYFDYGKENITFFKQGVLPMLDEAGKVILEDKNTVKFASDGNGGIFKALEQGILTDMKQKGIEWVYISGVDNILVNFVDEVFLGGLIDSKLQIATKSVLKEASHEKVGIICKKNNKPIVLEYTEIPESMLNLKKDNGELTLCEANIVSNIFSVKLLEKLVDAGLPYHVAKKKCDILDENGVKQQAMGPNAYKFETFIFDSYKYVDDIFILRVKREDEFAPIKNKDGEDSPKTATELYNNFMERNYKKY